VIARVLWDPRLDQDALVAEFLKGYYGAAAPHLAGYLRLLEATYAAGRRGKFMTLEATLAGFRLFALAEKAVAGDPALLARVRRERFPLDYIWATEHRTLLRAARASGASLPGPESQLGAVTALRDASVRTNTTYRAEGQLARPWLDSWVETLEIAPGPPPSLSGVPASRIVDMQERDLRLFNVGGWVDIADDQAASNRKAVRLRTDHVQWAVQAQFPEDARGAVRVYVSMRAEGDRPDAVVASCGVYDSAKQQGLAQREVRLDEAPAGAYALIDLGAVVGSPDAYVWIAPAGPGSGARAVWVDRIILVRPPS
jgi:hypothetical protein